jgi:hypothetical protein
MFIVIDSDVTSAVVFSMLFLNIDLNVDVVDSVM